MSDESRGMLKRLRRVRNTIAERLPFGASPGSASDPVADKMKDLKWSASEDEETERRQAEPEAAGGDPWAKTIYNARPQNPFSKDF